MNQHNYDDIESSLAALKPTPSHIDRDRLLYQAGFVAGRRKALPWQVAGGLAAIVCLGVAVTSLLREPPVATATKQPAPAAAYIASSARSPSPVQPVALYGCNGQLRAALMSPDLGKLNQLLDRAEASTRNAPAGDARSLTKEVLTGDML